MPIAVLRLGVTTLAAFAAAIAVSVPASALAQTKSALNLAMVAEPPTLDVQSTPADLVCIIMQHVYETLYTFDAKSNLVPMLAEGMPKVSADGKVYSIALRKGVKLHSGRELDAEDVVASLKRWMEVSPRGKSVGAQVESLAVKGPLAFEIALKARQAKLVLPAAPADWFAAVVEHHGLTILPLDLADALCAPQLPAHHNDPCDRFIIAAALRLHLPVVTADPVFKQYGVQTLA